MNVILYAGDFLLDIRNFIINFWCLCLKLIVVEKGASNGILIENERWSLEKHVILGLGGGGGHQMFYFYFLICISQLIGYLKVVIFTIYFVYFRIYVN